MSPNPIASRGLLTRPTDPRASSDPRTSRILRLVLLVVVLAAVANAGWAQSPDTSVPANRASDQAAAPANPVPEPAADVEEKPTARESSLAGVLAARRQIEAELLERQEALGSDAALGREAEIEAEIRALSEQLNGLNRNFSELAAGVDPGSIEDDGAETQLNLASELRDLLGPLVNELKRATSRPREIDRLRTEISELRERLEKVQKALDRLDRIEQTLVTDDVAAALRSERRDWTRRKNALATSLQVAQQKLDQRLGESQSISEAMERVFQIFFKSRGRNLFLALLAMIAFLFTIRKLRGFLAGKGPLSRRAESFEGRIISLVSSAFTVIGAVLVFLISLYFFGDWVLLILVILLILGIIWTSKQAIPRFWSQTVLILDMGVVREGERVHYNGLPWRVDKISFYSNLSNPALVGGQIRLPIDDLGELRSRPHGEGEPWFPTNTGDVVLLSDGRPAQIEFQSVENVMLRTPGQNHLVVPASEFASQAVERLSDGYRVDIVFGLDYGDQANITTSMLDTMQRGVESRWRESRWADSLVSTSVEFREAGASSLDYFVRVDLDGTRAIDLQAQKRILARFCVDICNENGWVIPFTQLTLHVAPSPTTVAGASNANDASEANAGKSAAKD